MEVAALLLELYGRVPPLAREVVEGLDVDQLTRLPGPEANPIAWLVWHLTRVQDIHIAEILEEDQLWTTQGWAPRFSLEPDPHNSGYGHTPEEVTAVRPESPRCSSSTSTRWTRAPGCSSPASRPPTSTASSTGASTRR